jgi:hypothetical protein
MRRRENARRQGRKQRGKSEAENRTSRAREEIRRTGGVAGDPGLGEFEGSGQYGKAQNMLPSGAARPVKDQGDDPVRDAVFERFGQSGGRSQIARHQRQHQDCKHASTAGETDQTRKPGKALQRNHRGRPTSLRARYCAIGRYDRRPLSLPLRWSVGNKHQEPATCSSSILATKPYRRPSGRQANPIFPLQRGRQHPDVTLPSKSTDASPCDGWL